MSPRDTGSSFFRKGKVWHPDMGSAVVSSSGYHQIVLDGYSDTEHTPTGKSIDSVPFTIGGYRWVLKYYPKALARRPPISYQFSFPSTRRSCGQ